MNIFFSYKTAFSSELTIYNGEWVHSWLYSGRQWAFLDTLGLRVGVDTGLGMAGRDAAGQEVQRRAEALAAARRC